MIPRVGLAAATLAAAMALACGAPRAGAGEVTAPTIVGRYLVDGEAGRARGSSSILIVPLAPGVYHAVADEWEGVGFFDGARYWGGQQSVDSKRDCR